MTVAELIEELQRLPQDALVLNLVSDYGYAPQEGGLTVSYARADFNGYWGVYWGRDEPTLYGFQPVILL